MSAAEAFPSPGEGLRQKIRTRADQRDRMSRPVITYD